jgi:inner membrane protein
MNGSSFFQSGLQFGIWPRSMGFKLIVVCGLAVMMTIPALFVGLLIEDRTKRAAEVVKEISAHVGGEQIFLGPTLAIPYTIPPQSQIDSARRGVYLVYPNHGSVTAKIATEERQRSLFRLPVFQADLKFEGDFDLVGSPAAAPPGAELDWSRAEIVVGVSDAHGALADATLTTDGKPVTLAPAEVAPTLSLGGDPKTPSKLILFGTRVAAFARPDSQFKVSSSLRFSGAQRIAVLAYGKTTNFSAQGDWPSPGFDGGFAPVKRDVTGNGFTAEWAVPFIARGVRSEGSADSMTGLDGTALGISLIEVADPYQSVNRSLKYLPLFLGLVFLSYFIFEATTGLRVHPAQYILVGIAQLIFYLLLLAISERIGFGFGFLIAGVSTVALLSADVAWIFGSRKQEARALAVFSALYALIYLLLRLEDNALLVGAIASFAAVAAAMYFTREIDWYGPGKGIRAHSEQSSPPLPG